MKQYFLPIADCAGIQKARVHTWFDTKLFKTLYGVQVKLKSQKTRFFAHLLNSKNQPMFFETGEEAEFFINSLVKHDKEHTNE